MCCLTSYNQGYCHIPKVIHNIIYIPYFTHHLLSCEISYCKISYCKISCLFSCKINYKTSYKIIKQSVTDQFG